MINKILNSERYTTKIVPISLFLVIELMLLLAFNLGDLGVVYRAFAIVLAIILLPKYLKSFADDLSRGFMFVFLPLVIYLLSVTFSPVFVSQSDLIPSQSVTLLNRGFFTLLMSFVGALAFFLLGYFVSHTKFLAKHNFMFLIFGGIAMLLLISLLATLVNYGFFHRVLYAGKVNYYDATAYTISNQANLLMGFTIHTVEHHVLVTLALISLTPAIGLLFIKDIKHKVYLYALIAFAVIGLIVIIDFVSFKDLIFLIPALLFALMLKFNVHKMKYFKVVMIVSLSLIGLAIVIGILASFDVSFVINLIKSNGLTNRIYYNGYTQKFMGIIKESTDFRFIFGNPYIYTELQPVYQTFPSGNLLLDMVRETGLVGGIFFTIFLVFAIKIAIDYINSEKDDNLIKFLIVGFLLTLFSRYMLYYPFNQLTFTDSYWSINYFPFVESKEFAITLFLIGYMYVSKTTLNTVETEVLEHA